MINEVKDTASLPIPPPALAVIFLIVALLFGWFLPLPIPSPLWMRVIGGLILAGGLVMGFHAGRTMIKAHTLPDPRTPTTAIVTDGPYRFSRNPIYIGFTMFVIGLPLVFGNYWGAILSPVVTDAFNRFIITREETYLEKRFGEKYLDYKSKVRRWL